jgi:site-specific DNA-adenine methylase
VIKIRYGLPYKGSKNAIAEWIVEQLPEGEVLVDLFCGGGAITHAAMLSRKWERFIMNDIDGRLPILFKDCAYGKYNTRTHPEWISREDFHRLKDSDAYVALVWSFGNNGKGYLYGADIEEYKHAYHILVFENNPEPLKKIGIELKMSRKSDVYGRYLDYSQQIKKIFEATKSHEHELQSLESVERLESLERLERLESLERDYRLVDIPDGAVIYCDIPYRNTDGYVAGGFDHEVFYEWAEKQDNIFISEYGMPEQFIEIASIKKTSLLSQNGTSRKVTEKLFTNQRTFDRYGGKCVNKQLELF